MNTHPLSFIATLITRAALGILLVAALIIIYIGYLLFWPQQVLEVRRNPARLITPSVKPGETAIFELDYCKNSDLPSKWELELVGTPLSPSLGGVTHFPTGCHIIKVPVIMPLSVPRGRYAINAEIRYRVNQIRQETDNFTIEPIEIVE